jgi:hypothetical protein
MRTSSQKIAVALLSLGILLLLAPKVGAQSAPAPAASASTQQLLKPEQLDQLLAPVALYPDTLLSEVMMASTYPLEVIEADRWAKANKNLKPDQMAAAADKQGWDDSVKSLAAVPSVLSMMSTKLDWTQKLGDAVLAQQADVMDAVQRLRARAQAQNKLTNTEQQKVSVTTVQNKQVIAIEPAVPDTLYVPYYDPAVVYGAWPYAAYPPYMFPYGGYVAGAAIASGIAFGAGVAVGAWAANRNWGGGFNWGNNNINVNRSTNINNVANNWTHNPDHRHGVRYNNPAVQQRFANRAGHGNAQNRLDFRGHNGQQALRPGAGGQGTARTSDRGRANAANRTGNRNAAGNRNTASNRGAGQRANTARRSGGRDNAFSNVRQGGHSAMANASRGRASLGGRSSFARAGGGMHMGGGARMGGGGGFRGGGGRRSDIRLKHDVTLLGRLDNGIGLYRFAYDGGDRTYVGVIAQEVQTVRPDAVFKGQDGFLRVLYGRLGVKFESYEHWLSSGARIPAAAASGTAQ